jgi:plastocyanin
MKKYLPLLAALAMVGAGCSSAPAAAPTPAAQPPAAAAPTPAAVPATDAKEVAIQGFAFSPATIKVKKGTTVTWTNKDAVKHTVTADSGKWGSNLLANGETYSYKFDNVGSFSYHCTPHPSMKGTVEVTE